MLTAFFIYGDKQLMLDKVEKTRKLGSELFHKNGKSLDFDLLSFWRWSNSHLMDNTLRGILAEYIVCIDIDCPYKIRQEWDTYDLVSPDGVKVEVKSASYIQSWDQKDYSKISFGIKPTSTHDKRNKEIKRHADVYVFCLLKHKKQDSIDPLDLSQWTFFILPTAVLNKNCKSQKNISLSPLMKLNPTECKFGEIASAIKRVVSL